MTPYDTRCTTDLFAHSLSAFETLMHTLSGNPATTWTHAELEEHLDAAGRELLRLLLQDHLDLRAWQEDHQVRAGAGPAVTGPEGRVRPWRETGHSRWLATVFGMVRVTRVAHRGPGTGNVHPADQALSLPAGRHSTGLRRLAVTEAVRGSFDQAHDAVERRCGNLLGKRRLEELVVAAAVDVDDFYRTVIPVPCSREMPLVVQVDGKGVVRRPEALREATRRAAEKVATGHRGRLAPGEKPNRKRMATVACVFDTRPAPRPPHDVIHAPGGRSGERPARPGPRAENKWCTASLARSPEQVIADAFDQAQARDPKHLRPWIVLVDGARPPAQPDHSGDRPTRRHGPRPAGLRTRRRIRLGRRPCLPRTRHHRGRDLGRRPPDRDPGRPRRPRTRTPLPHPGPAAVAPRRLITGLLADRLRPMRFTGVPTDAQTTHVDAAPSLHGQAQQ